MMSGKELSKDDELEIAEEIDAEDEDIVVVNDKPSEISALQKTLIDRCLKAGIAAETKAYPPEISDDKIVIVSFQNGKEKRKKNVFNP